MRLKLALPCLMLLGAAAGLTDSAAPVHAAPVTLDFSTYPTTPWYAPGESRLSYVRDGVLHLAEPGGYFEQQSLYGLTAERGWVVEASLRIGPLNSGRCDPLALDTLQIQVRDGATVLYVGFAGDEVCVILPEKISIPFHTRDAFHTYRIQLHHRQLRIEADGRVLLEHTLAAANDTTGIHSIAFFGGKNPSNSSMWDYFSYDVEPVLTGAPAAVPASAPVLWTQQCDHTHEGLTSLTLLWTPSHQGPQWLDVTQESYNWDRGFQTSGMLPSGAWGFVWHGAPSDAHGSYVYARVNTLTPSGWVPSGTRQIVMHNCRKAELGGVRRGCLPAGSVVDEVWWYPMKLGTQWLDVSRYDNGFQPGTYISVGPLAPHQDRAGFTALSGPSEATFVRVNTLTPFGWRASDTMHYGFQERCGS